MMTVPHRRIVLPLVFGLKLAFLAASSVLGAALQDQGGDATQVRLPKAGEMFAKLKLRGIGTRTDAARLVEAYTRKVAYNVKVNKGDFLRWSASYKDNSIVISDYLAVSDEDATKYKSQFDALYFPEPANVQYNIEYYALSAPVSGQPLPIRMTVIQDGILAPKGTLLGRLRVRNEAIDKSLPDEKLGFTALKLLANAVRAKLRVLGVPEPYASQRVPMAVTELEGLGAAMKLGKVPNVELAAYASSPVWTRDYTAVKVTWKASGSAPAKAPK